MPSTSRATPGPSSTSELVLRNRNINKRVRSDAEDDCSTKARRREDRNGGESREKRRRRKRRRKVSIISTASENVCSIPSTSHNRPDLGREKKRRRLYDSSDNEEDALESPTRDSKVPDERVTQKSDSRTESGPPSSESASIIAKLKEQLSAQTKLIKKHEDLLVQVQQSVSCQICLDLMFKPYALAPCGHVACYDCLVKWFTTPPEDGPAQPPHFRKKTCPHCRAVVREAPVAVWGVKSIATGIAKSGILPSLNSATIADSESEGTPTYPWSNIFKSVPHGHNGAPLGGVDMGFYDMEDGGIYRCLQCMHEIWDGICSFCGRIYLGHQVEEGDDNLFEDDWEPDPDVLNLDPAPRYITPEINQEENEIDEEEGYESSFIDDEDARDWAGLARGFNYDFVNALGHHHQVSMSLNEPSEDEPEDTELDTEAEENRHDQPPRRRDNFRSRLPVTRPVISEEDTDDSDDEELGTPRNSASGRRGRQVRQSSRISSRPRSFIRDDDSDSDSDDEEPADHGRDDRVLHRSGRNRHVSSEEELEETGVSDDEDGHGRQVRRRNRRSQ